MAGLITVLSILLILFFVYWFKYRVIYIEHLSGDFSKWESVHTYSVKFADGSLKLYGTKSGYRFNDKKTGKLVNGLLLNKLHTEHRRLEALHLFENSEEIV